MSAGTETDFYDVCYKGPMQTEKEAKEIMVSGMCVLMGVAQAILLKKLDSGFELAGPIVHTQNITDHPPATHPPGWYVTQHSHFKLRRKQG